MKKISVLIPTFNEKDNVKPLSEELTKLFTAELSKYDFEIIFIDNNSTDSTRDIIRKICEENKRAKAIFNVRNFGQFNSPYYGLQQATGDCVILMCADFQDPVELIPTFVEEWEKGYKIVCGIKTKSKENRLVRFFRTCYYKFVKKFSEVDQIEHFTGFGLYDKSFIETLKRLKDSTPFLRGIVAELGPERKEIPYTQQKRRAGKTHNNFFSLYDAAMLSVTSYTKIGLRFFTFFGFGVSAISFIVAIVYLIMKLVYWDRFIAGSAPSVIVVCIIGGVILFSIGMLGEYIISINTRLLDRPLVIEEERINFNEYND